MCALMGKQAGECALRTGKLQIARTIVLAKSSRHCPGAAIAVAQGNAGIASDVHLFGRSALELHAAVCAFDGFTIPMDTDFQMILEFYGNVILVVMVFLHLGQDIGLAAIPEISGTVILFIGHRGIPENPDGTAQILFDGGIHGFASATGRNGKCPVAQDPGNGIIDLLQLVFRSRPAGDISTIPILVGEARYIVPRFIRLVRIHNCLIPHNHRAGCHRIEAGDILGQLQGKGGIAARILAGNDADVVVLRGICGVIHQVILRDTAFDGHFLIERGVGCFTIITRELQTIFQGGHGVVVSITALIGNPGHGRRHDFIVPISPIGDPDGYRAHPIILVCPIEDQCPCFPCFGSGGSFS